MFGIEDYVILLVHMVSGDLMRYTWFLGGSVTSTSNCLFQELTEYVLGLKFSIVDKTEEICISAMHQSSGNS